MNKQFGRLLLAGVCGLIVASAAQAQPAPRGGEDLSRPSHRDLNIDFGDLSQAQDLLAQRLRHAQDFKKLQDLVKPLLKDKGFQQMLQGVKPEEVEKLQEAIKNNPKLLDDPTLRGLLKDADKFKQNGGADLSQDTKDGLARWAKDLIDQHKSSDLFSGNPATGGSQDLKPFTPDMPHIPEAPPPPVVAPSDALRRDLMQGMADIVKDIDQSAEGEALRKAAPSDLAKPKAGPSSSSSGMSDFLQNVISPQQASWLTRNLKLPSLPNFGGWSSSPSLSAGPSIGGASPVGGGLEPGVWVIALALFGVAAWLALRAAHRQAAGTGTKAWSAGPWPVHPSRVSTREDLIRAFEHLAFLCLGPTARHLNHLDVAGRLGKTAGDRAGPAARLAHLYEQARYAPPDELLPADELTAARGDLSTLAGAAA
jgi:hypothetical protein